jgi:hypothetical protein
LNALVPRAIPSATALDLVLQRLVLAQGRRPGSPTLAEADALGTVLARRTASAPPDAGSELIASRMPR